MNKIFKVIWSKSKQCYVVVSEIAKNKTGKKKIVVAGIFAALAMIGPLQSVHAVYGAGDRAGFTNAASGVNFNSTQGLAIGLKNGDKTSANGNVSTVAIGAHSNASGSSSVAIGGAVVNGAGAIGLGWSTATGDNAVALGGTGTTKANGNNAFAASGGSASGESAIAIGASATANSRGGIAVGWNSESAVNAVGIGFNAKAKANNTVAIGVQANNDNAISNNYSSVSVGVATRARAVGSMAMGVSADASGKYSIALGSGEVSGDYTANANYPKATGEKAIAIGYNSNSSNANATAIGASATASGTDSFAGVSGTAGGNSSIAIGKGASITAPTAGTTLGGQDSIAIGSSASAQQHSSISVGLGASSDGVRSVAIGPKASATDEDTIAIGTGGVGADKNNQAVGANGGGVGSTLVNGVSGVSLYYGAKSSGKQSIAIGYIANAKESGIAFGNYAVSDGGGGTAIGKSVLSRNGGVVVGQSSNAIGKNSVAYGNTVKANGETSTAMGYSATADGQNAVAVGYSNTASNKDSVAIGNTNQSTNQGSVTVGYGNNATNDNAVAIGRSTNASGLLSTAIGNGATSQGTYDVAIGSDVTANGNNSVAIGRNAKTSNTSSLAIGVYGTKGTSATGAYSIAMGRDVTASAESAIAIGKDAVSDKKNAVAIGSGTDTSSAATAQSSATIAGKSYSWSKGVLSGADLAGMQVSVGKSGAERQIKNVAAGEVSANSTDAINGSQLYAVASGLAKDLKVPYVSINSTATGAGSNVDNDGAKGSNSIAIGPSSTVTRQNGIAIGSGAQSLSEDSVVIGRNAKAETKTGAGLTTTSRAIVIGSNSRVAADITQGVAIGSGLSPDEGAVVTGDQSIAIGGNVKVDGHSAIAIGGDDARKAANQLVSYTNTDDTEVTGTLQTAIQNLTGYNLSNYKGTTASHAGVAYGTSALAGNAGVAIGTAADSMTRMNDKGQVVNNKPVTNAVAIGTGARANFDNSVAIGGGSNTDHYATKQVNAVIDGVEVKWSGGENISPGDVVSFGAKGFERQLKNVAPGEVSQTSTDAVNGSQIYSLARKVTNIMNGGSGSVVNVNATGEPLSKVVTGTGASKVERYYRTVDVEDDGTLKNGAIAQTPTSLALVNVAQTDTNKQTQTPRILGNVANGVKDNDAVNVSQLNAAKVKYFSVNSTDAGNINNDGATGTDAIAIGPSAVSNAVGSVALGKDAKANGDFTVALGGGNWQFKGAQANGVGTTALGTYTRTKENTNYQTAIGFGSKTEAQSATAIGYNAAASGQDSIALGTGASSAGQDALTFGRNSQANGNSSLAMGLGAQANSDSVISLGYQANNGSTNNNQGVAIGWAAGMQSNGLNNVGVGTNAGRQVIGNNNTSLGNGAGNIANTKIYTSESIMLGTGAKVVGSSATKSIDNVIAIGKNTSGSASSAIAVGINAGSSAENGVAIGPNSNTSAYNGIALGSFSEASTAAGVSGYNVNTNRTDKYAGLTDIALTSKLGAVSVGNSTMTRQITGVAAGTNDTDAVNIAQLKSVNLAFTGNTGSGDVNLANSKLSINGDNTYIKTAANGKQLTISPNVQNITLNNGRASASTGLADASNVAQAINNVVSGVQLDIIANKGTKTGSVNLSNQKLTVTGGNGIRTDIYSNTSGQNLVIGLEPELVKATTKGIGLTGDTGSTGLKYLKDGDATFKVAGDGNLVTTVGSAAGVKVSVDSTKVKDLAVEAVTVSKANTIDNAITVTPIAGTNSKDYAIGIDTTKLAAKTNLAYTANGGTVKTVSLAKGLNFVNGTNTVATVDSDGKVSFDLNQATKDSINKSATAVGRTITLNADSGTGSSQSLSNGNVSFAVSGATGDYISTTMDGSAVKVSTKRATINSDANTGAASVTGADGLATAKNVASAINNTNTVLGNKITKNAQDIATNTSNITANKNQITTNTTNIATNTTNIANTIALADDKGTSTTAKSLKDGNVSFNIKGDNKYISTAASGNDVTLTVNEQAIKDAAKSASSFKVKANTHAEEEVKGGDTIAFNNGDNIEISQNGKTFTIGTAKNITVDSVTAGNTVINTSGLTNGTTAITGTGITTDKVTVGGISIDKTAGINAGSKVISNVASGTVNNNATDDSNAANIGDVKQAVANLSQNLNITDGTNNGTVDLKNQKLNVAGANGVTATVNNQTITVGLDANTVNATTKGIGLTADTGSTGNKYLKDGDVSFAVTGDGNLVSTTGTTAGVKVAVDAAKVKDLAVAAVTVSKDTQADNPITVTPTAGTNSKDYAIGIDTTKLAAKTDLTYRANSAADANAKKISLSKGLNFVDGGSTVATVDNDGKVSFDLNTATKNQISTNTTNIATNTTDIAANKGNITKNTASIATNTAALARNISLGADTGTASSQSLSTADVAFNVKGATGDFISTNMNGNTVEISTTRATINSNATTGEASVTGNDGLATAKNVADAINKAADAAKAGAAWNITTNSSTTDKTAVKGGDTVDLVNGDNIEITQDGTDKKKITVATKKDITVDSVTANNKVTVGSGANKITLDGTDGSVTGKTFTGTTFTGTSFTGTSFTAGNTVINTNGLTNGTTAITGTGVTTDNVTVGGISIDKTTGINAGNNVISNVASGGTTLTNAANIGDVQNAVANLSQNLNITDGTHDGTVDLKNQKLNVAGANGVTATVNNQTITVGLDADTVNATTKGIGLTADTGSTGNKYLKDGDVSFAVTGDGSLVSTSATAAGVKVAVNSATITAGADGTVTGPTTDGVATAKNVADAINAAKKASKTEITANTGEATNATTGNVTLTSTTAADGHTIYDVKLNDKVTLGTGANAVTIDGTTGAITGKTATIGGVTVNGTANTIGGLSNTTWNGTATTGRAATEDQLKAVADAASSQTWNITADKAGTTGAQTGTKKNATVGKDETVELVAGDNLTINQDERKFTYSLNKDLAGLTSVSIGTGTTETIKLDGATGKITAKNAAIGGVTVDGDNKHVTGLSNTTWNGTATTGRAATEDQLKAVADTAKTTTDAVNLKFSGDTNTSPGVVNLKDDTLGIVGDGKYVSTDANGKNLTVKVSEAEIKKSAVAAVTVSTDTTDANNPLTVTPTTSADATTKDYKVTIDGTKIANKTNLSYKANDGTAKQVSLADGLNFKNGTLTTASIDDAGVVKYDVNTAAITAGTDGTITGPTKDGVATAKNVADAINAAKKASKTEITANTGEAANATTGNVTLTSTTAADGHTIYDVKLNDKVTLGTGANAVTVDGTTGAITGKTATIGGVTVNGTSNTISGLSNTTWNGTATTGQAATEDQLKAVADAAGSQTWEITADKKAGTSGAQTGTKENAKVGKDDKVSLIAGENLTVDQVGKNFTYSLNTDLVKMNSATFLGTGTNTTVITGDSITQTAGTQTNTSTAAGNTVANGTKSTETTADGQVIKDGTKINTSTVDENTIVDGARSNKTTVDSNVIDDGNGNVNTSNATSNTITDGTNTSTITAGKATIGSSVIDGVNNTFTTGGANAVKLDGAAGTIKTGTVTVTGGTTNDITGLSNTTVTAADFATKGRAATEEQLKAATGATTLKFTGDVATNTGSVNLKDDTFGIKGDGKYISTDVNGKNVNLTVSEAEVKKSAVAAVTVSTDTTDANNPISVTPTTSADGTTKDYKVTIDSTKIANKTNLSYKANDGTPKQVSLADGLNFKNGTLTTASIDDNGVVKYDVNTASITAGADGTITGPTTDGVATAQNVADAINAAKKASKTEITANTGEAANATTGNVTLTSTTAADGHTIYDVKLNDKVTLGSGANAVTIDGTAGKATIGSSIVDGVNNTFTTGGASPVTLNGATGTITGKTANIGGVTVDGTNNHVMGLANKDWTPGVTQAVSGRAATEDQLQKVSDAVGAGWKVNTGKVTGSTGESNGAASTKVASGEEVQFQAGNNLVVDQNGKTVAYSLNKALKDLESATFNGTGTNKTVINGDSITQTAGTQTNTSTAGGNTVADGTKSTETTADGQVIKDGAKSNKSTVDSNVIDDGNGKVNTSNAISNTITDGTNTSTIIAGKATIGSSIVDGVNNTFTTGGANAVKLDGVAGTIKTGTVTVTGGTTNDITGLSNTTVTAADFATKGRAATEEQLKAVGEQTWQITADKDTATSGAQTGTKKDAKVGKDDKVQLIAGENLTVNQNERDFTYSLNKNLVKMNSATFEATGGKTTVIKGDSIVQTDGTKVNTSTAGGNTVADGTKSTATTVDGTTVTSANGNTKYAADGVHINTTGKTPVSLTDAGLDNGNNVIKNVASGHVNNDATDNTNAANIADVKKATTTVTANAGEAANATTGNVTLTSTTAADGHTIYDVKLNDKVTLGTGANAVTIDGTAGKSTIGSSVIDGVNNTFTTGGANAVKLDGTTGTIKTGTVTVTGGTTNDITGLSNTTVTATDFATKGRAATEEQLKAVGEQTWQITADKDATTSGAQTGTKKDAKVGKDDKVQLIAGENMTVNQNERDFTFTLNKDLVKMNSATFEATGGKTTVIKGDSIVQTDGTKTNTATASGNTVANGTKSTETTAAGQVIKDGAKTNTSTVDENTIVDGAKSNKTTVDSNVIDDGNGNVNTSNATSNTITDGTNTSAVTAGKATIGTSVIDGVNNTFTTGGANAVKLDGAAGTIKTGTVTVTGGTTNDITGLSNTTVTSADFATKGRAATEEQLKAVGEQTWQITADKDATTSGAQTGTKKDAKVGKDDKVQLIAGENITVSQNERDFTYSLNKDLVKMNSATFEATGGKTTVIKGDSIVQTAGTQTNTSTAAGNTVADGTKSTETTAAGQVIKDGAKSNKSTVDNNVIDDGNGNVNTSNATSNTITDGTNTTATTSSSVTVKDNAGNSTVITKDNITTGVGANKITLDGTAGKATVGASVIDGVNNTFTTGGANAVKLDGVAGTIKTGTVTVTGGTTNDITGLSNTTVTAADFATKGRAATEEQLKAVGEQTWQITADKDATTSGAQTGTKKDAKVGKDDKVQLIAGENMTVNQNERDFTFTLNKDLVKMNSATFEATGGKTTVIKGDSIVQTDGTKVNTSTAGGNTVADGTKSTETTADGQVIKDGTKTNTSTVDKNTLVDGAKSNKATVDSNVVDDGNGNVNTSNATSNTITDGTNRSTITAGKATIGSSVIDGVNNTFTTGGANAVKLDGAAGTVKTGTVTVTGGTTNDITGLSNTTVTAADFATKGRAATEEQLKAVGEQTWQITADKDATTSGTQTGTKKDAKVGKDDKVQLIAGENMTVNQNERDFTFTLNKDLVKMNSATFLGTGTNKTVITGDSITQTAGTQTNTFTAGGNTVADGTKSTETTAAGQVIKDGAKSNKSTVDNNVIDDGNGNVNTSNATSNTITDGTNTTATTSSSVTVKDNAGNSTVITKDNITTGVGGNKITLDGTAGKATIGASVVDGVNNTFTTGGTNAVKLYGAAGTIKTGTVIVTGGTTNDITGLSNTTVTAADFATKGRAATEEQLKAVGEQTWQITADKDATTSGAQTGTKKDAKVGKDDKVQLIAGENMTVNQNERDFTFTLNKDLVKMNSATFLGTGSNTTVITGNSITQTAGTQTNTSTAGGNTVADGTKSTETTAAGQVIKDGAKSNKSTVDNNVIDDSTGNVNTSNATSNTVTDGTNTTATTSSSVTVKDNAGNSTVITKDNITTGVGANKVTLDGTAGKATFGSSVVDGVNNTFTTGGANAVKLNGVAGTIKTGTVTVTGGTTNDITGLSNTTVTAADFATKGRAATEEQLKAVGEQTWQITADKDATTSGAQTGTKKDAKVGKDDKVQLIAGENMTVNQNERDFTFTLNKDLVKMNSATFLGTGSNTTVITGNSITQTAGTQTNTSTAGGNTVADGTKSTETTAAGQVIKDGAKSNKSTVDSNVIDDGNGNKNTSNATSNTITDGTNTSTITAGKANIGNIAVDGVNNKITMGTGANPVTLDGANGHLDGLTNTTWVPGVTKATTGRAATENQLQQVSDAVGAGWKVNTGTVAGSSGVSNGAASTKVSSGEEVKLQAGDNLVIDQNGKTVSYSLNKDLTKMNSATFEATGGKTTVIKGDSIVQTDGGKTNTSNAAGNTVVDGNKSTATTAAGTTITDGAKTNTSTADKNVINDGAGNKSTFTKDGITITKTGKDTVSLTSNGLDNGKNKIVNVAAGVANTDAVNVGQLKEYAAKSTTELTANNGETAGSTKGNIVLTKTTAADGHTIYDNKLNDKITLGTDPTKAVTVDGTTGTVTGLTNKTWTPGSIVSGRAATEDQLKEAVADSGWKAAVDKEGSGQSTVVGTSPEKIKAEETVTFKAGNNMMVTQTGKSISYAVNPELTNMTSATFKDAAGNTTVTNGNGITITPGSANPTNPHAGPVSLTKDGLNNGNNQIKGVAPGTDPTDAVNVSQLNTSNANTSQAINQIAGEVQHVGAHAAAMAALKPIQYDPLEPTQVMAGVGNYRGETAAALGLAHYTNENTMFNVGVSVGGNHNMVNAGVTHKFGYSPEKKNIPDRYKAGPISSVYVMQDEVSSLKKENAEQKYVIADQAARLTTLEAENEQQRRELAETKKGLDDLKAAVDKLLASKG